MRKLATVVFVFLAVVIGSLDAEAATCFCKWEASGCFTGTTEVQKDTKGGLSKAFGGGLQELLSWPV